MSSLITNAADLAANAADSADLKPYNVTDLLKPDDATRSTGTQLRDKQ